MERVDVIIVGAGQSGLAVSHELTAAGVEHVVLERGRVGEAFDEFGFPFQRDGVSTVVPGLFFVGVPFLRTRKSSLFLGVDEDATIVSRHVDALLKGGRPKG